MGIRDWWRGIFVPYKDGVPPKRKTSKGRGFFDSGYYQRPWLAFLLEPLISFYLKHWQWFWGTSIALVGLYIEYVSLK